MLEADQTPQDRPRSKTAGEVSLIRFANVRLLPAAAGRVLLRKSSRADPDWILHPCSAEQSSFCFDGLPRACLVNKSPNLELPTCRRVARAALRLRSKEISTAVKSFEFQIRPTSTFSRRACARVPRDAMVCATPHERAERVCARAKRRLLDFGQAESSRKSRYFRSRKGSAGVKQEVRVRACALPFLPQSAPNVQLPKWVRLSAPCISTGQLWASFD